MTKIICISDTHNKHNQAEIPECDILIHAGDMSFRGYHHEITSFLSWFKDQPAQHKIAIPGNHDFYCQEHPSEIVAEFKNQGCELLIHEHTHAEGLKIFGSPWTPWYHNWAFNFKQEDKYTLRQASLYWEAIDLDTDIVVTHGPPYGVLDLVAFPKVGEDPHVGCKALRDKINKVKPILHIFGHIHEAKGQLQIDNTLFINASFLDLRYTKTLGHTVVEL